MTFIVLSETKSKSRDTLDENLGLIIEVQASVFPEYVLDVREHLERNGELGLDVTVVGVGYCAGVLVVLVEGACPRRRARSRKSRSSAGGTGLCASL